MSAFYEYWAKREEIQKGVIENLKQKKAEAVDPKERSKIVSRLEHELNELAIIQDWLREYAA